MVNTRETHADLDGVTIPNDEAFQLSDGDRLMYPGDPSGAAENTINCHCVLIPGVADITNTGTNVTQPFDVLNSSSYRDFTSKVKNEELGSLYTDDELNGSARAVTHQLMDDCGYSGYARKLDQTDYQNAVASFGTELYRGTTNANYNRSLLSGDYYVGHGAYGHGTYTATDISTTRGYGSHVVKMSLDNSTRVIEHSDLIGQWAVERAAIDAEMSSMDWGKELHSLMLKKQYYDSDISRYAVARGYDVIKITASDVNAGRSVDFYNILNRTKIVYSEGALLP